MPEVRVRSLLLLVIVVGGGVLIFVFFGSVIAYWAWEMWAKARGYTDAKTPNIAMEKFREAIQNRDYDAASRYTTKPYGDLLKQAHGPARELGTELDYIRTWGDEKGLVTDKLRIILHTLDPFPKNFKMGAAPKEDKDGKKATGGFEWEPLVLKNPGGINFPQMLVNDYSTLDATMYVNLLAAGPEAGGPQVVNPLLFTKIELVKEGEDWKLNIPATQLSERAVNNFLAKHKTYYTGLHTFKTSMSNERYDNPGAYEKEVLAKLRAAKN